MSSLNTLIFGDGSDATPLIVVRASSLASVLEKVSPAQREWVTASAFRASQGAWLALPASDGRIDAVLVGVRDLNDPLALASLPRALPNGRYRLHEHLGDRMTDEVAALGWGLGTYRFTRYRQAKRGLATLVLPSESEGLKEVMAQLAAIWAVRDMVNTPSEDMGPQHLEQIIRDLAERFGATVNAVVGDDLLAQNFPAIHAVGRASHRAPRLIQLQWGEASHPKLSLVGKGVCFDTGGLDMKNSDGMRNMKKDMGGAAHAIALAQLIMDQKLPVHLTLLVSAVENAVGPEAYRPGEIIATRKGISVEIDNTDAEGRIVLCDAIAFAAESAPDLIMDFATLTGAARTALGPDLPALFANDDSVANSWLEAGESHYDPVWRMPLWRPYLRYLHSDVADIANAGSRMAGAVTAALYLEMFVPEGQAWAHLDVYAWNDSDRPGRPSGGEAMALRSAYAMLKARYN